MPNRNQFDQTNDAKNETEIKDLPEREKDLDMKETENVKGGLGMTGLPKESAPGTCP